MARIETVFFDNGTKFIMLDVLAKKQGGLHTLSAKQLRDYVKYGLKSLYLTSEEAQDILQNFAANSSSLEAENTL